MIKLYPDIYIYSGKLMKNDGKCDAQISNVSGFVYRVAGFPEIVLQTPIQSKVKCLSFIYGVLLFA